jgi:hypothetical protein
MIIFHPTNFLTLSLGATVGNNVIAYSPTAMSYQWRKDYVPIPGQTSDSLTLTNLQLADKGDYDVIVTDISGSATSSIVPLDVDPTFTKITMGVIVTDAEGSISGSWADYDGDGFPDLFVANSAPSGTVRNDLYHNERGTNFTRVATGPVATDRMRAWNAAWADYDNDGLVDLIVANIDGGATAQRLYRNLGGGNFVPVVDPALLSDTTGAVCPWWFDYNKDGFVDLFIGKGPWLADVADDCLFRNNGDGTFRKMSAAEVGSLVSDQLRADACWSADIDNDGRQELTVVHKRPELPTTESWPSKTWRADSAGMFAEISVNLQFAGPWRWWGDYDNDGWLDAFATAVTSDSFATSFGLLRNLTNGDFADTTFQLSTITPIMSLLGSWGDYDNDGWLDFFYAGNYYAQADTLNAFYRNNGDGTFTQIVTGNPVYDGVRASIPSWIDYDNDGSLDLFIAVGDAEPEQNLLYHNNGNTNHWLKIKLEGRVSNRLGIGAKVRAQATINGGTFWQVREVQCANAFAGHNGLLAHFGLGGATNVTTLRIEWPSGIVQKLQNVAANQSLTVVESQGYIGAVPQFSGASNLNGGLQLTFSEPAADACYILEASTDLVTWTKLMAKTSTGAAAAQFTDSRSTNYTRRFYRLQVP